MAVLLTGGAGYIGSHICIELLQAGMDVVVIDTFSNSKPEAERRVQQITGLPRRPAGPRRGGEDIYREHHRLCHPPGRQQSGRRVGAKAHPVLRQQPGLHVGFV